MKLLCCFLEAGAGSALCLQAVPDAVGVAGGPGAVLAVPLLSANPDFCPNASSSGSLSLAAWFAGPASAKRGFRVAGGCPSPGRTGLAFVAVTPVPLLCGGWGGWSQGILVVRLLLEACPTLRSLQSRPAPADTHKAQHRQGTTLHQAPRPCGSCIQQQLKQLPPWAARKSRYSRSTGEA